MTSVTLLPQSRPLTRHDLASMPDDGHRYELVDGTLIVTPAPSRKHQSIQAALLQLLMARCPPQLEVLVAPVDVVLAEDTVFQPDILVVDRAEFRQLERWVTPLLAIEVLSPSTRLIDLNVKKAWFERSGCPQFWIVDPEGPAVIAWDLRQGETSYAEVAHATGEETLAVTAPFAISVTPADLDT